jgi:DNA-binding NarL/FixJ family response regulator
LTRAESGETIAVNGLVIRVLVISEICLWLDGLRYVLDSEDDMTVVGTACGWPAAETSIRALRPQIVLLDMSARDSIRIVGRIATTAPSAKVVALAVPDGEGELIECAEAGVAGFVTRRDSIRGLLDTIRSAARDELRCTPREAAALLRTVRRLAFERAPAHEIRLTARQRQVAALIQDGLSNKEIASRLSIELPTVKNHVHTILEKLELHSRHELSRRVPL